MKRIIATKNENENKNKNKNKNKIIKLLILNKK
jgi:hypothetical protein